MWNSKNSSFSLRCDVSMCEDFAWFRSLGTLFNHLQSILHIYEDCQKSSWTPMVKA